MKKNTYSFKLGDFECLVIYDGECAVPTESSGSYQGVPRFSKIELDTLTLLVKTPQTTLLLDTGWGVDSEMQPNSGLTVRNLKSAGIQPEEIDSVIISHGHIDHISGIMGNNGKPVFPNARYYMSRKEWEFWMAGSDFSSVPEKLRQVALAAVKKNLLPIKDKMIVVEDGKEIFPGISILETPGHSFGHIVLAISSGRKRLFCLCDSFHHTSEIEKPDTYLVPPITGEAAASRTRILSSITPDDLVYGGHFQFPGLGHIVYREGSRRWEPIST